MIRARIDCESRRIARFAAVLAVSSLLLCLPQVVQAQTPGQSKPGQSWSAKTAPLMTRWAKEVTPENAHSEYPRPQMVRPNWLNLNGLWDYAITDRNAGRPEQWAGQILVPFPVESALSGVMQTVGPDKRLWYRRRFKLPEATAWKNAAAVLLHFGAVDWETRVIINGKDIGSHRGGYDPFNFNITDALKSNAENEIIVSVWDPSDAGPQPRGKQVQKPEGIWYTPTTGIWQTVWLEPVAKVSIRDLVVASNLATKTISVTVALDGTKLSAPVRVTLLDGDTVVAGGAADSDKPILLQLKSPKLWSPETPFLYGMKVELYDRGTVADSVQSYTAMRQISREKDANGIQRLVLNGEPVFQFGPLDQGFWPDGLYTAPTDAAMKYDIEMTKAFGFNMIRKHVKVEPARWYYYCDQLGMLVWQDMPSGDASVASGQGEITRSLESDMIYRDELMAMIDARRFFQCIVMWVPFNEGWGQYKTVEVTNWVKQYDPSRLVNNASGWNDYPAGDVIDFHIYPGPGSPKPESNRSAVLGEYGGLGLPVRQHTWQAEGNWGYRAFETAEALQSAYLDLTDRLHELISDPGCSAAVYTQTTDVEVEVNGLMTYDREIIKIPTDVLAAAHNELFGPAVRTETVLKTSQESAETWDYTFDAPPEGWEKPGFAATGWKQGPGGFGEPSTPNSVVRTEWKTNDIWLRKTFNASAESVGADLRFLIHHDEDATIYINGVLAAKVAGYTTGYGTLRISKAAADALKPNGNVIAVHCHQTGGGQYIDVGIVRRIGKDDAGKPAATTKAKTKP